MKYLCIDRHYLVTQTRAHIGTFRQDMHNISDVLLHDKVLQKSWDSGLSEYGMGEVTGLELGLRGAAKRKAEAYAGNA